MRPLAAWLFLLGVAEGTALAGGRPVQLQPAVETPLGAGVRAPRVVAWAAALPALDVISFDQRARATVRLYAPDGAIDDGARAELERVAGSADGEAHPLSVRVEQLLVKAAHHFRRSHVVLLSAWRAHAGRHATGEAIDFQLEGIRAAALAAYLRGLPRAGVGVYTHPRTQFVHLDVRGESYHWIDASPPGVHWRERQLRDPGAGKRDAAWSPEQDLPSD
jgi:hypothetical protein